jgi:guanylate kinase
VGKSGVAKSGKLIVVTGPSGVGKGTLIKAFLAGDRLPKGSILLSTSATTRQPRTGELNGREYYFLSRIEFEQKIESGDLLEWAEYAGNLYGTPRTPVVAAIAEGKIVLLEIELAGARQVAKTYAQAQRIFIAPPSIAVLQQRLNQRGTDSEAAIAKRLQQAEIELAAQNEFDLVIVNDNLEIAVQQLELAFLGENSPIENLPTEKSSKDSSSKSNLSQSNFSKSNLSIAIASFIAVFLAEIGDKTQLTTLVLAAESHSALTVFVGVAIALTTTSFLGVVAGKWLSNRFSPQLLNTLAGCSFLWLSLSLLWEAIVD